MTTVMISDDQAVDAFAAAMKAKLIKKRAQFGDTWHTAPVEDLAKMLVAHIAKGDPVDVANFAMMLFHRAGGGNALASGGTSI